MMNSIVCKYLVNLALPSACRLPTAGPKVNSCSLPVLRWLKQGWCVESAGFSARNEQGRSDFCVECKSVKNISFSRIYAPKILTHLFSQA